MNAFAESLDYADVEKCVRHIRDRARRACITQIGGQFEGGPNRLRINWDADEMLHEMSKPNCSKYIIVPKYVCSFIGLRFNLKKTFQQKDSVDR